MEENIYISKEIKKKNSLSLLTLDLLVQGKTRVGTS